MIKVRFHLSLVSLVERGKICRLGREYWVLRTSLVRCWKCFKALSRSESERILIKKYSIPSGIEGVLE